MDYLAIAQHFALPHWLTVAGGVLVLVGGVGIAVGRENGHPEA